MQRELEQGEASPGARRRDRQLLDHPGVLEAEPRCLRRAGDRLADSLLGEGAQEVEEIREGRSDAGQGRQPAEEVRPDRGENPEAGDRGSGPADESPDDLCLLGVREGEQLLELIDEQQEPPGGPQGTPETAAETADAVGECVFEHLERQAGDAPERLAERVDGVGSGDHRDHGPGLLARHPLLRTGEHSGPAQGRLPDP